MGIARITTGVSGLDEILYGGLPKGFTYLIEGPSGAGKTTIGLQFVMEGVSRGEKCLYVLLSETRHVINVIVESYGFNISGVEFLELRASEASEELLGQNVFRPADIELPKKTAYMLATIKEFKPQRLVLDSLAEMRLLTYSPIRYRQEIVTLKNFLTDIDCTTLVLDTQVQAGEEHDLRDTLYGSISLNTIYPEYGSSRGIIKINKVYGSDFIRGYHNYKIQETGLKVFPRPELKTPEAIPEYKQIASGVEELDTMLGGGLEEGTSCLLLGQSGTGRSSIATLFAYAAALKGKKSSLFIFEERADTFIFRSQNFGMKIKPLIEKGLIELIQVDAGNISPGEFTHLVNSKVDSDNRSIIVIDSVSGYLNSMPEQNLLTTHLHELISYLSYKKVLTILTMVQQGFLLQTQEPVQISYIADKSSH